MYPGPCQKNFSQRPVDPENIFYCDQDCYGNFLSKSDEKNSSRVWLIRISIELKNFWMEKYLRCLTRKKARRFLRYAFTGMLVVIESLAQRGVGETPERPPKGVGWLAFRREHEKLLTNVGGSYDLCDIMTNTKQSETKVKWVASVFSIQVVRTTLSGRF